MLNEVQLIATMRQERVHSTFVYETKSTWVLFYEEREREM